MLIFERRSFSQHVPWIVACLVVAAVAILWFTVAALRESTLPGGGSWPGFTFGVAGGLICLFEFLLWPRKWKRSWRVGRVQTWMRAHIWLGLLAVPLLVLHSGFRFGGPLSTTLMILFLVVILSGIYGLVLQQFLPTKMMQEVSAETIYSQIDRLLGQYAEEADRLVMATCGPEVGPEGEIIRGPEAPNEDEGPSQFLVVGAVRAAGGVQGKVLLTRAPKAPVANSEALRIFFRDAVRPFLLTDNPSSSPLNNPTGSDGIFQEVRTRTPPAAHEPLAALEDLCRQRRQLDEQARLHWWLHSWLWVHLPLSAALIVLMFVHVFVTLKYL